MATKNEVAARLMEHLCNHNWHGYTQGSGRWGDGEGYCYINVDGADYQVAQGDRDCSSAVISAYEAAGVDCGGATYTGNMRVCMTGTGNFEWMPMSYIAQRGDIYLNERDHTAMCTSAVPDILAEFSINESGGIVGGQVGDQTGRESHIRAYYNYPWNGILRYTGKADKQPEPSVPTVWDGPGTEYAGTDRYETARIVAEAAHPNARAVMRTKSSSPYDALTGMWRAGQLEAQVIYAEDYLYLHDGTDGAFIGSDNRFGTNRYFNEFQREVKGVDLGDTCFVVPGDSWADGMAIAPVSYRFGIPIILYEGHRNFYAQIAQFAHVVVIGNTVPRLDKETDRIAGVNRYETAVKVAERYCDKKWGTINICTGKSFSDGIAAAQLTGRYPLLFAEGEETLEVIKRHADEIGAITWIGGLESVGYEVRDAICKGVWLGY